MQDVPSSRDDAVRAVLATLAPSLLAPAMVPQAAADLGVPSFAAGTACALILLAGAARYGSALSRVGVALALTLALLGFASAHPDRPGAGLVLLLGAVALGSEIWPARDAPPREVWTIPVSAAVAIGLAWMGWTTVPIGPGADLALAGSAAVPAAMARGAARTRGDGQLALIAMLVPVLYTLLRLGGVLDAHTAILVAIGPALLLARARLSAVTWRPLWRYLLDRVAGHPARLLVASFAALCCVGTLALSVPVSSTAEPIPVIDALFTAVSATCVTGLTVLDTAADFSWFGQLAILALIQLGGLGIMTFASAAVIVAGRRLGVRQEAVAAQILGGHARSNLAGALGRVLAVTAAVELGGTLLLIPSYIGAGETLPGAIWNALFTSVSAFCNAGFALRGDNLTLFRGDPYALFVVSLIVILGSFGPVVTLALPHLLRGRKVPMHVRLTAIGTLLLLLIPFGLILALEWTNTLRELSLTDRIANAWFLAVVPRTAGFNAVDIAAISPGVWTLTVLLMFIGGNTGSTAGGIKVTTAGVLFMALIGTARGRRQAEFGYRQIPHRAVYESLAITGAGVTVVLVALMMLQLTQRLSLEVALFEVVSAVATVGLSIGGTAQVDAVGKIVLIACMFAGRVGPLTLFMLLSEQDREQTTTWPSEEVPVG